MKNLLFQFAIWNIILISNTYAEAKNFKFYQKVKVISGFYEGCVGSVTDKLLNNRYLVELTCNASTNTTVLVKKAFDARELRPVNETK